MVASDRVIALDLLRGLAVAGMILVVSGGSWIHGYGWVKHAAWDGWTLADLVFPTFLFSVGAAIGLSFPRPLAPADRRLLRRKIARRTALLILLGLALNALEPPIDLATTRFPGILQRIALCYAAVVTFVLATARRNGSGSGNVDVRAVLAALLGLLASWTLLLLAVPVPGFGAGRLDPEGNIGAWFDRLVFTVPHLWTYGTDAVGNVVYDPEGLLSTLGAMVNTLVGVLAATAWRRAPRRVLPMLVVGGVAMIMLALLLDPVLPINKRIWTASFALLSSGIATLALAGCALLARSAAAIRAATPLLVLGGNAIIAFVASQLLGVFGGLPILHTATGRPETPQDWGFAAAQRLTSDLDLASLLCALAILILITLAIAPLHRRGLHLRL